MLNRACFIIMNQDVFSTIANKTGKQTRKALTVRHRTLIFRLIIFYCFGAVCVFILISSEDPTLLSLASTGSTANCSYSLYIIAMSNMGIKVLPHIVNAPCLTSAFYAGNSFVFMFPGILYALAQGCFDPKFFQYCTKSGVPIYFVTVAIRFSLLSLMQLTKSSSQVLSWILTWPHRVTSRIFSSCV